LKRKSWLTQISANTLVQHSNDRVEASSLNIPKNEEKAPAPIDPSIDKWFYISGASA
jgi:inorganic pyrophosphatase